MKEAMILSMILDFGWKVWTEKTKHMTPAEVDAFIWGKEQSIKDTLAEIEEKYGS